MDSTLTIFASVALAAAAVLFIVLAISAWQAVKNLNRMTETLEAVGSDVQDLKTKVVPVIEEAGGVLESTNHALAKIDTSLDQVNKGTQVFQQMAEDVRGLEQSLLEQVKPPLDNLGSVAASAVNGVSNLIKSLLNR